jgi:hypothetical protein
MLEADYFERKRRELGMERSDVLSSIQAWLDKNYPGQARAKQLHRDTLRIITPNASVASELRMRQLELLLANKLENVRLSISISALN